MKTLYKKPLLKFLILSLLLANCSEDSNSPSESGKGGSMARFAVSGDHLYTVSNSTLSSYNITDPNHPVKKEEIHVGDGIETIFPYNSHLFLGSQTGMYIYDISEQSSPKLKSNYQHIFSCDPVAVNSDYAYITLRNGSSCRQGENRLEIVNIKDLSNPQLLKAYPMTNPQGLGVDGDKLFVCDNGLKVFDVSDPLNIILLNHFQIEAYDVIPMNGTLMVVASDGLYQYSYTADNIKLLSKLTIPLQ